MTYYWTIVLKNRNRYLVQTDENNIKDMLNKFYPPLAHENSFSIFELTTMIDNQNFVLLRYSEISEILWNGTKGV